MRPRLLVVTALVVFFLSIYCGCGYAQTIEATAGVTTEFWDVNGNKAKLFEYADRSSSKVLGKGNFFYDSPSYFLGFSLKDPGYDTQHYRLNGGAYGKFKYWFDYNEIVHNRLLDARTSTGGKAPIASPVRRIRTRLPGPIPSITPPRGRDSGRAST
jgi:hypothetical protein